MIRDMEFSFQTIRLNRALNGGKLIMEDKVFDFVAKKNGIDQINHKFIKEDSLEKAIQKHHINTEEYDVVEMTLDEFVTIRDMLDKTLWSRRGIIR